MKFTLHLLVLSIFLIHSSLFAQTQVGHDIDGQVAGEYFGSSTSMSADGNRIVIGVRKGGPINSGIGKASVWEFENGAWQQLGEDIEGETNQGQFGFSTIMSADGNMIAIGAPFDDEGGDYSGKVKAFQLQDTNWVQMGNDIIGEESNSSSGHQLAMSSNGQRLAISAPENNGSGSDSGHVRVFDWDGNDWIQVGEDIDGENQGDESGTSIAFSADGNRIAIGAPFHDGINGTESGQVRVYDWQNNNWTQNGTDLLGNATTDYFGFSLAISADGNRLSVGAPGSGIGYAKVFEWNGNDWSQLGMDINDSFGQGYLGIGIAISTDGNRVAIAAPYSSFDGLAFAGHVEIHDLENGAWIKQGENLIGEAFSDISGNIQGNGLSFTLNGTRIAIGAELNDPGLIVDAGHVRVFDLFYTDLESNDECFTLLPETQSDVFVLEGDFSNCNIFILNENENVVQFLLNTNDKITINVDELPEGLHFIRVEHQTHDGLFYQDIIKED